MNVILRGHGAVSGVQESWVGPFPEDRILQTIQDDETKNTAACLLIDLHGGQQLIPAIPRVGRRQAKLLEQIWRSAPGLKNQRAAWEANEKLIAEADARLKEQLERFERNRKECRANMQGKTF